MIKVQPQHDADTHYYVMKLSEFVQQLQPNSECLLS